MKAGFEELNAKLEAATVGLAGVSRKRVFSRNTFFVDGKLFALVWREGRIGVKLPDPIRHAELSAVDGAQPWIAWGRSMMGWVLVPTAMHSDTQALARWVKTACEAVRIAAPAPAQEGAVARVEPVPSLSDVPRPPPVPKTSGAPKAPPPLPKAASLGPKPMTAPPIPKPPPSAPHPPPPAAEAPADEEAFSFGDEPAPEAAPAAAADSPPAPVAEAEAEPPEFSFDAPEVPPAAESSESQEFDFGGGEPEPPAPAAAAEANKKKKGKGKKKTG